MASREPNAKLIRDCLENRVQARFFEEPAPVGWTAASEWLGKLSGRLFGSDEKAQIFSRTIEPLYLSRKKDLKNKFSGKKALVFAYQNQWEWLWSLLESLEVEVLESTFYRSAAQGYGTQNKKETGESRRELIQKYKPDIVLSNYAFRDLPPGTVAGVLPFYPAPGFFGDLDLAERWLESGRAAGEGWRRDLIN